MESGACLVGILGSWELATLQDTVLEQE